MVWVAPSLERIGRNDLPGSGAQAQLSAGRGEYESFQIVVHAPSGVSLTNVNVAVTDLTSSTGQTIPRSNLTLFREQYVYVSSSSPDWGGSNRPLGAGWYADGLIPFVDPATGTPPSGGAIRAVPYNLAAGTNQPFWVDVFVPRSAMPDTYSGSYTVTSDQGSASGAISLQVWHFTLPLAPTLKSSFAYFQANTLAAQEELLRNKVTPLSVSPTDEVRLINGYGLSSTDLGFWSSADVSSCRMPPAPSASEFQAAAMRHQSSLYLFNYSADEIGECPALFPTLKQWGRNLHQAGINNLVTIAPVPELFDDGSGTGRSAVDDWVVLPNMYQSSVGAIQQALQKGDSVWSYNTVVRDSYSPKWQIDFAPINFRIQPGFISQSLNLTGLLYWRVDLWSNDAWNNVNNAGMFSAENFPGEGMLVYPGQAVGIQGVAPSMRLKWIRDGVEDYEYVALLKQAGYGSWAMQIARSVGGDWTTWTRDTNVLESARRQLGRQLDALAVASVVNAASMLRGADPTVVSAGTVAPGEIITLFGSNLGPDAGVGLELTPQRTVGTRLAGTRLLVDGVPAPLLFVQAQQINAVVPYSVPARTSRLVLERDGVPVASIDVAVGNAAPGIFTMEASGKGQGAVLNQDGKLNSPAHPAAKGSVISIYATGAGQMDPPVGDGSVMPQVLPLPRPRLGISCLIGGQPAQVVYAGAAPGLVAGVLQVNVRVPQSSVSGNAVAVTLVVGNIPSQAGVTLAVR